ncbi:MAG TPA: hypothetical protein RMH99_09445 [Sandaracinaceae bacterium LLY-WYZ-13_1]|nr:hypothetical protein [Sandaracinaceae bacterium LLY-WYZ-13_1]
MERVLNRVHLQRHGCALFWLVWRGGRVVAGVRVHGPHATVDSFAAPVEMAESDGVGEVLRVLRARLGEGVVEMKGAWVRTDVRSTRGLSGAIARCVPPSMRWFRARYAVCTADRRLAPAWRTSGAAEMAGVPSAPYPDARYETAVLWWDSRRMDHLTPEVSRRRDRDLYELAATARRRPSLEDEPHGVRTLPLPPRDPARGRPE